MGSKIRMRLSPGEIMSPEVRPFVRMFLCGGCGVVLRYSQCKPGYVAFGLITEDDGFWSPACDEFWLPELMCALEAAYRWCELRCSKIDGYWVFNIGTPCMHMRKVRGGVYPEMVIGGKESVDEQENSP